MSTKNKLHIRAQHLDLNLEGEAEYVEEAYKAVRGVLMERFRESIVEAHEEAPAIDPRSSLRSTDQLPVVEAPPKSEGDQSNHVNVVLCSEVYNKIYVVELRELPDAFKFGRVLDLALVNRIYVNRAQEDRFPGLVESGRVLWRELTSAGKAAVKGG